MAKYRKKKMIINFEKNKSYMNDDLLYLIIKKLRRIERRYLLIEVNKIELPRGLPDGFLLSLNSVYEVNGKIKMKNEIFYFTICNYEVTECSLEIHEENLNENSKIIKISWVKNNSVKIIKASIYILLDLVAPVLKIVSSNCDDYYHHTNGWDLQLTEGDMEEILYDSSNELLVRAHYSTRTIKKYNIEKVDVENILEGMDIFSDKFARVNLTNLESIMSELSDREKKYLIKKY